MFSAFDEQNNTYFATGSNSETREDCINEILSFLMEGIDVDDDEAERMLNDSENTLDFFEVRIDEHKERMIELEI